MAIINFPDTTGQPTDGSFTYTFEGVLYSWTGTYWAANSQSGFDSRYVEVAGDTMTGNLTVPSLNGGQLAGFRNQLINGGMNVWQRATDYDNTSNNSWNYKTVDRWRSIGSETDVGRTLRLTSTATSITGMPKGFNYAFAYWDKADPSTRSSFCQAVELAEDGGKCRGARPFTPGGQWTLSCYCSADITPIQARLDFADSSGTSSNDVNYGPAANWVEIEAPTSTRWGRYAVTFTGTSNTFVDSTRCMRVVLGAIGRESTPPQFSSVSSRVAITGVQLEPGPVATPFEHRPIGTELALCQRYYQTCRNLRLSPQDITSTGREISIPRYVIMRVDPTEAGTASGSLSSVNYLGKTENLRITGQTSTSSQGAQINNYTADAEL